jgi:hypothetical protein
MLNHSLRGSFFLIAISATFCFAWGEFAHWGPPTIIEAICNPPTPANLPGEYHLDSCSMIAGAVPLAAVLHLVIVVLIASIDRKKPGVLPEAAGTNLLVNVALMVFSAAFLALTVLSADRLDYTGYLAQWSDVLEGRDPWNYVQRVSVNAYGPLFNLLAPLARVNPLANKLLFAFVYLVYVIWLIKDFGPRRGFVLYSCPWMLLLLLNPLPWWQIAYLGHFDILVGLACVAAVHCRVRNKDWLSGACLAVGILLKFMPIVILPFLAFNGRRVHFRLIISCIGVVVSGLVVSVLVWGTSTFKPLKFAATREAIESIYVLLEPTNFPLRAFWDARIPQWLNSQRLAEPLLLIAGLGTYVWCVLRRTEPALSAALAILVTLLFYWVGWAQYQMVFFVLILYWAVSEWERSNGSSILIAVLGGYFSFLVVSDVIGLIAGYDIFSLSNTVMILLRFLAGCALAVALSVLDPYERFAPSHEYKGSPHKRLGLSLQSSSDV